MALKTYEAFTAPSPYDQERMRAERLRRYVELLQQQSMEPEGEFTYQGIRAMPSPAAALGKMLQAYQSKKALEKAEQAEAKQAGMEQEASNQIIGRLMGGRTPGTMADLQEVTPAGKIGPAAPEDLTEVQLESQYTRSPEDAMRMAMSPQGAAAVKGNPMLAAALQRSLEAEKTAKSPYGSIDPGKFTQASLQKFDASVRAGKPDYTLLDSREYSEMTPQQIADLAIRMGEYGIKSGQHQFETGQVAPPLPRFLFQSQAPVASTPAATTLPAPLTAAAPIAAAPPARLSPKQQQELQANLMTQNLERVDKALAGASKLPDALEKTYAALDIIEGGDITTGFASALRTNVQRAINTFKGVDSRKISNDDLLDALLGSDVFGYVQSLGVGARGLDTVAERDFLLKVMTGNREMSPDVLRDLTLLRAKVMENNINAINQQINAGDLDWYYNLQAPYGVRKKEIRLPTRRSPPQSGQSSGITVERLPPR